MLDDFRGALRQLWRHPGLTIFLVLTLSVAVGLNVAVFTVVNAILLRPLAGTGTDRLVTLQVQNADGEVSIPAVSRFLEWRNQSLRSFQTIEAALAAPFNFSGGPDGPRIVRGVRVTGQFFELHKLNPVLGRLLRKSDDGPGRPDIVVLSHGFWHAEFGGATSVIGQTISLNQRRHLIVGVAPAGFTPIPGRLAVFVPFVIEQYPHMGVNAFARLAPNVSIEDARTEVAVVSKRLQSGNAGTLAALVVDPVGEPERRRLRPTLLAAFCATGLLLLVACANIAGILLARGFARRREYAIRRAVGATVGRLALQAMAESALTAAIGLFAALYGSRILIEVLAGIRFGGLDWSGASVDGRVLLFAALLSFVVPLLASLGPALSAAAGHASSGRSQVARRLLVVLQVGAAFLLVCSFGLLAQSLRLLRQQALGYEPRHIFGMHVRLPDERAVDPAAVGALQRSWKEKLTAVPGVESVALAMRTPLSGSGLHYRVPVPGAVVKAGQESTAEANLVDEDYFRTMRIPLIAGRTFTSEDRPDGKLTLVVNQTAARRFFPGRNPIGERLELASFNPSLTRTNPSARREIVGVVGDSKQENLRGGVPPLLYFPAAQNPYRETAFLVRAKGDPAQLIGSVRRALMREEPDLAVFDVRVMETGIEEILTPDRHVTALMASLAGLALLLALLGVYGVVSYSTARRSREFGVRMALGASPGSLGRLVLVEAAILCAAGVGGGLASWVPVSRLLEAHLFGVPALHWETLGAAALLILATGFVGAARPARRASRLTPDIALRSE